MKIKITESQYRLLIEQLDSNMPGQIEKFGYKQGKPETYRPALKAQEDFLKGLSFEEFMEKFREALYSPEGVALSVFISSFGWGVPAVVVSYGALLAYDIYKWIETGEPDYINLFFDVLGLLTSGSSSILLAPLKNATNLSKTNLPSVIKTLSKTNNWQKIKEFISNLGKNLNLLIQEIGKGITWISEKTKITLLKNAVSKITTKLKQFINDILEAAGINVKYATAANAAAKAHAIQTVLTWDGYDELFPKGEIPQIPLTPTDNITQNISPQTDNRKQPPPRPNVDDRSNQQTPTTTSTIPEFLKNVDGVKKFQDWLDQKHPGWATGYPNGILKQAGGYGRFGPKTKAAWNSNKGEEYKKLNSA